MPPTTSSNPTSSSKPSTHPTISPEPTISLSPTQGPQCEGSNPDVCGCASVNQTDYRGSINTTASGKECVGWDEAGYTPEDYPDGGLEDNNYCRTPHLAYDDWDSLLVSASSWCLVPHSNKRWNVVEFCDVPFCFPPASSCPSVLDVSTNTISEELQASCAVVQCIVGADSNSNDSQALIRSEVKPDCSCAFEVWDCQFGSKECNRGPASAKSQALMKDYACCASKLNDSNLKSSEASCECLIGPYCDAGDSSKCFEFAEYCCQEDDQQCKCDYQTRACRLALESDVEEVSAMAKSYCGSSSGAVQTCCPGTLLTRGNFDIGGCRCDYWEPLCTDFPNAGTTCSAAAVSCCGEIEEFPVGDSNHCDCDFLAHAEETLGYDVPGLITTEDLCSAASVQPDREVELQSLQSIYTETGGEYWLNNTGWTTDQDLCSWFGITCDEESYVIEINLPSNNVTGDFPSDSLSSFYKLTRLDLCDNSLHGTMAGTTKTNPYTGYIDDDIYVQNQPVNDTSIFFNLRDLAHVDLSQNNLSGEVDVLFTPALQYANFSHNYFTSINSFKKFKKSHQTLTVCDVSHNSIKTSTSDLMTNVPPNIERFILSNNLIHGPLLTSSLEVLANLRTLDLSMNSFSGEVPDFSNSNPNLQVLDLSEQEEGLVGIIPESLANLPFLSTLNLNKNHLSGSIPPVLGNMGQLRVLNLSSNKLSQTIPKELGKLGEFAHIICAFCCLSISSISPVSYGRTPLADLELFDLSNNELMGKIPSELDNLLAASIHLSGNLDM